MRIAVGADHNGYALKQTMADLLRSLGHDVVDVGAHNMDPSDDYPDFAGALALTVASGEAERGVMVCGSGRRGVRGRKQGPRSTRRGLSRHLLSPPGRRA